MISKSDTNMIYLKIMLTMAKSMKELNIDFKNIYSILVEKIASGYLTDV